MAARQVCFDTTVVVHTLRRDLSFVWVGDSAAAPPGGCRRLSPPVSSASPALGVALVPEAGTDRLAACVTRSTSAASAAPAASRPTSWLLDRDPAPNSSFCLTVLGGAGWTGLLGYALAPPAWEVTRWLARAAGSQTSSVCRRGGGAGSMAGSAGLCRAEGSCSLCRVLTCRTGAHGHDSAERARQCRSAASK